MANIDELINRQIHHWDHVRSLLRGQAPEEAETGCGRRPQPVVTFSPALGCGSRFVTDILSQQTGFQVFGYSLIDKIAEDIHVQRRIVDRLDERAKSQIEVLVEGLLWGRHVDREEYMRSLIRVMRALVVQGGVILIGRGANFVVESKEAVRVRLVAPVRIRVENLKRFYSINDGAAYQRIRDSDRHREEFVRAHFKKDIHDPMNYDLTLNLGTLQPQTAANMLLAALDQFPCFARAQKIAASAQAGV